MVNLHRSQSDWDRFARDWEYKNLKDMLHDLYVVKRYSARRLGAVLGIGRDRATQLLRKHGVEVRSRGGWHR